MLGEHAMGLGIGAKERKATAIAHRDLQASVDKRLPPVRIVDHVADGASFAVVDPSASKLHSVHRATDCDQNNN